MSPSPPDVRILFAYPVCGLGGVETSILNKIEALRRAGIQASALFSKFYGEGGQALAKDSRVQVGLTPREIRKLLVDGNFDAIVVVDYPEFIDLLDEWRIPSRILFESHVPPPLQRSYHALSHPGISTVVVPSRYNKDAIERIARPRKEIVVLPNPVDTAMFYRRPAASAGAVFGDLAGSPTVLWVGRLEEAKNPDECIRIATLVLSARPGVRLVMTGDADDYQARLGRLSSAVPPSLKDRVTFIRWVDYHDMPALYSLAAETGGCLLLTSRHESLPMVIIEAFACRCPVVAPDVAGIGEVVIDGVTGRLYQAGALADAGVAVTELLDPAHAEERDQMAERAYRLVAARHSLSAVGLQYREILDQEPLEPRPLVSAVMIFLNSEAFIEEAIRSVLAQTYDAWELLLVDDGSTDGSSAIAKEYAARHPGRIRYLEHPGHHNRGKWASRSSGARHATGKYLAFLDADDVWLPRKLEEQVGLLEAYPEAAMLYGRTLRWHSWTLHPSDEPRDRLTDLGVPPNQLVFPPDLVAASLREDCIPATCSVLIRLAALREESWSVNDLEEFEDLALYIPIFLSAPVFASSRCWDLYRQHPDMSCAVALRRKQWHPANPNPHRRQYLLWLESVLEQRRVTGRKVRKLLDAQLRPYRHPLLCRLTARLSNEVRYRAQALVVAVLRMWRRLRSGARGFLEAFPNPAPLAEFGVGMTTMSWRSNAPSVELRVGAADGLLYCRSSSSGSLPISLWAGESRLWYLQDSSSDGRSGRLSRTLDLVSIRTRKPAPAGGPAAFSLTTVNDDRPRTLLIASGRPLVVGNCTLVGRLERVAVERGRLRIVGWAASVNEDIRFCTIVVFMGGQLAWTGMTGIERPDLLQMPVGALDGSLLRKAGFECAIPGETRDLKCVRVFAVSTGGEAIELHRLMRSSNHAHYRLAGEPATAGERLVGQEGEALPIAPGGAEGFIEVAILGEDRALIMGWAIDTAGRTPPEQIAVFVDDQPVRAKPPHIERPDVVDAYGDESVRFSGFSFNIPHHTSPARSVHAVRVFALLRDGQAAELRTSQQAQIETRATGG
jgi:glycosyltransferase involved in cell wall biosynthesis